MALYWTNQLMTRPAKSARALWTSFLGGKLVAPTNKYRAEPTMLDGIRFASRKESRRYAELRLLENAGAIQNLELQPRFPIMVAELWHDGPPCFVNCGVYTADFRYVDVERGAVVVEDTKSDATKTEAYRLRKRLIEAIYGIKISEV